MTRVDFFVLPTIQSQMPAVFANGAQWDEWKGECFGCKVCLPDDRMRGHIVAHCSASYREAPTGPRMFTIDAYGLCDRCDILTTYRYDLHDDMSMTGLATDGRPGRWGAKRHRKASVWERISGWLAKC